MPTWTESLTVGVAHIDDQHRELFARGDELLEAMREGRSRARIGSLVDFLRDYCVEHLEEEAALMRARRYPELTMHLAQHEYFTRRINAIAHEFAEGGPSTSCALSLRELLEVWFVKHIATSDAKLGAFVGGPGGAGAGQAGA
jgi:hemerythrin